MIELKQEQRIMRAILITRFGCCLQGRVTARHPYELGDIPIGDVQAHLLVLSSIIAPDYWLFMHASFIHIF